MDKAGPTVVTPSGSRRLGPCLVAEARYRAGFAAPLHTHDRPTLHLPLRGRYNEEVEGQRTALARGDLLYKPAGVAHANRFDCPAAAIIIQVDDNIPHRALGREAASAWWIGQSADTGVIADLLSQMISLPRSVSRTRIAVEMIMQALRACASTAAQRTDPDAPTWFCDTLRRLDESDLERPPRLGELARLADVHPSHLARRFRRLTGVSIGEQLRARQVRVAIIALAETSEPLAQVAARSGFSDQSHMGRAVREATGMTPSELRRLAQGSF